jgi:hypothetical protein
VVVSKFLEIAYLLQSISDLGFEWRFDYRKSVTGTVIETVRQ